MTRQCESSRCFASRSILLRSASGQACRRRTFKLPFPITLSNYPFQFPFPIILSNARDIWYQSDSTVFRFVQVFRVSEAVTEERKRAGLPPPAWVRRLNAPAAWAEAASDKTAAVANVSAIQIV